MKDGFNPRDIPLRAHYDRLMTWATGMIAKRDGQAVNDIQQMLFEHGKEVCSGERDDEAKIIAVMAEIGFCAVIDSMADEIERASK